MARAPAASLLKPGPSRWLAVALFAAVGFLAAAKMCQDVDNDLFWQLKDGERVMREHRLPVSEDYSFTMAGREMVATEWLAEALAYEVYSAGGYAALVAVHTALFLLAFALLLALLRRRLPLLESLCLLSLASLAFLNFYGVRAQNWTFLLLALFLYGCALWEDGDARVPWAMAALLLPWANLHGGFMLGWAILAVLCLRRAWESRSLAALAPWGLGTVLCCVHPNGITALVYPLWFMAAPPASRGRILEWRPTNFGEPSALPYLLLLVLLLWTGLEGIEGRFPWGGAALVLAVLALRGRKLLPAFTLAAAAALSYKLRGASAGARRLLLPLAALSLGVMGWVVFSRPIGPLDLERSFPRQAAELIGSRYPGRRVFNDYDWGGYLIFKLFPGNKIFVDGRLDPYWALLPGDYATIMQEGPGWRKLIDDYGVTVALLKPTDRLAEGLSQDPAWRMAYADRLSVLFVR